MKRCLANFVRLLLIFGITFSLTACIPPEDLSASLKKLTDELLTEHKAGEVHASPVAPTIPTTTADSLAEVTFVNVPVHTGVQSVRVGQMKVVFAKIKRTNRGVVRNVYELTYTNLTPRFPGGGKVYDLTKVFLERNLQLRDNEGDLVGRVNYWIQYDSKKLIVHFPDGYVGKDSDDELELVGTVSPDALEAPVTLSLTSVAYESGTKGELLAGDVVTTSIVWKPLPQVEAYWSKNQFMYPGQTAPIMYISVVCPIDESSETQESCELSRMSVLSVGVRDVTMNGYEMYNKEISEEVTSFSPNFYLSSGESSYVYLTGYIAESHQTVQVNSMTFMVGGVEVVPRVLSMQWPEESCQTVIAPLLSICKSLTIGGGKG